MTSKIQLPFRNHFYWKKRVFSKMLKLYYRYWNGFCESDPIITKSSGIRWKKPTHTQNIFWTFFGAPIFFFKSELFLEKMRQISLIWKEKFARFCKKNHRFSRFRDSKRLRTGSDFISDTGNTFLTTQGCPVVPQKSRRQIALAESGKFLFSRHNHELRFWRSFPKNNSD